MLAGDYTNTLIYVFYVNKYNYVNLLTFAIKSERERERERERNWKVH